MLLLLATLLLASPRPTAPPQMDPPAAARLVELARTDLATRLKTDQQHIKTRSVQPRQWPDGSLGCPQPGMSYIQVITPGFLIELESAAKTYRYHSDLKHVVRCDGVLNAPKNEKALHLPTQGPSR